MRLAGWLAMRPGRPASQRLAVDVIHHGCDDQAVYERGALAAEIEAGAQP